MEQVRRLLSELSAVGDRSVYLMSGGSRPGVHGQNGEADGAAGCRPAGSSGGDFQEYQRAFQRSTERKIWFI